MHNIRRVDHVLITNNNTVIKVKFTRNTRNTRTRNNNSRHTKPNNARNFATASAPGIVTTPATRVVPRHPLPVVNRCLDPTGQPANLWPLCPATSTPPVGIVSATVPTATCQEVREIQAPSVHPRGPLAVTPTPPPPPPPLTPRILQLVPTTLQGTTGRALWLTLPPPPPRLRRIAATTPENPGTQRKANLANQPGKMRATGCTRHRTGKGSPESIYTVLIGVRRTMYNVRGMQKLQSRLCCGRTYDLSFVHLEFLCLRLRSSTL